MLFSFASTASTAFGAEVEFDDATNKIHFRAGAGELNNLVVTEDAGSYVFTEFGTTTGGGSVEITDGDGFTGCSVGPLTPNVASCPTAGVDIFVIGLRDEDDIVDVQVAPASHTVISGGFGVDQLSGSPGPDRLFGNEGQDRMLGNDGNDYFDTGYGGYDLNNVNCAGGIFDIPICRDEADGGFGEDTLSYESRDYPVYVDGRVWQFGSTAVDDPRAFCRTAAQPQYTTDCETDAVNGVGFNTPMEKMIGTDFDDWIVGGRGPNTLIGGAGSDVMCGGLGEDTVDYSAETAPLTVSLDGNPAMPTDIRLTSTNQADIGRARSDCRSLDSNNRPQPPGLSLPTDCVPGDGKANENDCVADDVENITGGSGNDTLIGNNPDSLINEGPPIEPRGANVLRGGAGDDYLNGQLGPDTYNGGPGIDTVSYSDRTTPVSATIDGKGNDGANDDPIKGILGDCNPFSGLCDQILDTVEKITGGSAGDTLGGSSSANTLTGGGGADKIFGAAGDDQLSGGDGDDDLSGGSGTDNLSGGANEDVLDGGVDADVLDAGTGNDFLYGGLGGDTLTGGDGTDVVDYSDYTRAVSVSLNGLADDGYAAQGTNEAEGDNVAADVEGANGGNGNDHLVLSAGDGAIDGGDGDDVLDGGAGGDSLAGGPGLDTADYSSRATPVSVDVNSAGGDGEAGENDSVADTVEQIYGGAAGDFLTGGPAASVLVGNGGNDALAGGGGDDQLFGGPDNDTLDGGSNSDTLAGGDGNDALAGQAGNDTLQGGGGNDGLDGGTGGDSLGGGSGTDTAAYAGRTRSLAISFDSNSDDGESGERDAVKTDVENTNSGQGNDSIMSKNGLKNSVSCGRGSDQIMADTFDEIGSDCEKIVNPNPCKLSPEPAQMSKSGAVRLKVSCIDAASGRLSLETAGKVKTTAKKGAKARKLALGRKSFSVKAGQSKTLSVKISRKGRRVIQRRKSGVNVRGLVTVRQSFGVRALSTRTGDRLKIKAKR